MSKKLFSWICCICISLGLISCSDRIESVQAFESDSTVRIPKAEKIAEAAPPNLIQELSKSFDQYQPQVNIVSPKNNQVLKDTTVNVDLEVKDLPIFKNEELGMGPHLHFFVDDKPYQAVYSTDKPVVLEDLTPGTHTIRVFASRPWHESFKNEGAYAQATFNVLTASDDNNPDSKQPLVTYSRPQGTYGAEPIMLDFYLTNAPLHFVAQENSEDDISDWRIRVTVNGEDFLMDTWQPIYLEGFNKGQNWVKLEFIDDNGDIVKNTFNSTVRVINYDPNYKDTLGRLVKGKISLEEARAIVEPNYQPPIVTETTEEEEISETETEVLTLETETEIVTPETELEIVTPETELEKEVPLTDAPKPSTDLDSLLNSDAVKVKLKEQIDANSSPEITKNNDLEIKEVSPAEDFPIEIITGEGAQVN